MTDLAEPPLTGGEVRRRIPSLALIDDDELSASVMELTRFAPAYFWERAGSTSGYHNAHKHGLWAHTLKLSTIIERLADSYVERGLIRHADVDRAHAAAILHDQRKAGEDGEETLSDHDWFMGGVIRQESDIGETVARAVESHMGPWYSGPIPQSHLGELAHVADMVASDNNIDVALPAPMPEELREFGYEEVELDE